MSIDFGGKPSAIAAAFHTSLHSVALASGETHIANVTDLAIPSALTPVVHGANLSNFFPRPQMVKATHSAVVTKTAAATSGRRGPDETIKLGNQTYYPISPADLATIYNLTPLFNATATGTRNAGAGVTIAVVEQTDINPADWHTFRSLTGLKNTAGVFKQSNPGGCSDPGFTGDEGEAALDAEWSSAAAPDATIIEASCASTALTFGVATTLQESVEHGTTASVLSISYGGPEQQQGASFLAYWVNLLEEGAAQGLSVSISSGDSAASFDENKITENGLAVNGLSTNPYNTTLGGTDFGDTVYNKNSTYFRPTDIRYYNSAKSYVPEIPWDNSCSSLVTRRYLGYANGISSCNDPNNPDAGAFQNNVGGSGGQSILYAKPSWQNIGVPGMPADGVRDQPDVSLFAANGLWLHYYPYCDTSEDSPCSFTDGFGAGGTSFAAPIFAGITALIVQKDGNNVGLVAPRLYELAKTQFTNASLATQCNSSLGKNIGKACVFNNVTLGDISGPCYATTVDCYAPNTAVAGVGVLRAPSMPTVDAFPTQQGYSLATGLGSVNVTNLVTSY